MSEPKFVYIRDLTPSMKNVNLQFIVLDVGVPRRTRDGSEIRTVRIADKSGSVNLAVWNENGSSLQPGDICRLINGYSCVHKSCLSVTCGKLGELQKISEFTMVFNDYPFISVPNPDLAKFDVPPQKRSPPQDGSSGGPSESAPDSSSLPNKTSRNGINANSGSINGLGNASDGNGSTAG
ncbi:unnamed protein product [Soboliphyme baturini]|uniref:OB domain-containing protein n=1 Tax=Soboliphyme baturini TaxID=241478 RepID=A0A183IHF8_9BILA|nr:unnamed protein product [Soboliphyme baturini]